MSNHLWQRLGAACGIVYVVLLLGGGSIGGPDIQIVFLMEILAFLFFLFFLGNLWSALRRRFPRKNRKKRKARISMRNTVWILGIMGPPRSSTTYTMPHAAPSRCHR